MNKIVEKLCTRCFQTLIVRNYSSSNSLKVTILGAGANVGKSVALMLKQSPFIDELCLYDTKSLAGFAKDLNYLDTKCNVTAFYGNKDIQQALTKSSVVVVLAAVPHNVDINECNILEKNAPLVKDLAINVAKYCPRALIAIGTEPINSMVPMFSEVMKRHGHYNPLSVFGITTIDVVRANKFVAEVLGLEPECVVVPIIGGHSEKTIVPILSKASPCSEFTNEELEDITNCIRQANQNLIKLRVTDVAYLSNAFAIARFVVSLVKAFKGQSDIIECAYIKSKVHPQLKYMVSPILLGPGGVAKNLGIPEDISDYERCLFENAIPLLIEDIKKGEFIGGREMDVVCGKLEEKPVCDPCDPRPKAPPCPPDHCELQSVIVGDKN